MASPGASPRRSSELCSTGHTGRASTDSGVDLARQRRLAGDRRPPGVSPDRDAASMTSMARSSCSSSMAGLRVQLTADDDRAPSFDTLAVHAGAEPDATTGAVSPPIYQTSTFAQDGVGRPRGGYEYARSQNPTRERLERAVAALEQRTMDRLRIGVGGDRAIAELAGPGDEIVVGNDVCGGTFRYLERVRRGAGVDSIYVDLEAGPDVLWRRRSRSEPGSSGSRRPRTRCSRSSTSTRSRRPSGACGGGRPPATHRGRQHVRVACPAAAAPARRDIVFHSATKYLAGHSDTVVGVAVTSIRRRRAASLPAERDGRRARGRSIASSSCAVCGSPISGWSGTANAAAVAAWLRGRTDLADVRYPGFGGMVSFIPAAGGVAGRTAAERATAIAEGTASSPSPNRSVAWSP